MPSSNLLIHISFALATLHSTLALQFSGPEPTEAPSHTNNLGWTPKPTTAPELRRARDLSLFRKRQGNPANTCGFEDGDAASAVSCAAASSYNCVSNTANLIFACCTVDYNGNYDTNCNAYTAWQGCYDYTSAYLCTGDCLSSYYVCDVTSSMCTTAYLIDNINNGATYTHYGCDSAYTVLNLLEEATTTGNAASSSFILTPVTTPIGPITSVTGGSSPISPGFGPATTNPSPGVSPPPVLPAQKASHAGAIAGGVIGGLVGLSAIAAGVIFLLSKRKADQRKSMMMEVPGRTYDYGKN